MRGEYPILPAAGRIRPRRTEVLDADADQIETAGGRLHADGVNAGREGQPDRLRFAAVGAIQRGCDGHPQDCLPAATAIRIQRDGVCFYNSSL
jgi:hypothetical protein